MRNILLPEESHKLNLDVPYEGKQLPVSLHYTYLDITERPDIRYKSVTKKNLAENHIQNLKLKYTYPKF